jgi:ABC-type glycerol-3-phosphate transport system permease component
LPATRRLNDILNDQQRRLWRRHAWSAAHSRFLSYQEDTTGALYAFSVMVLAPGLLLFLLAQKEFIRGLTSGATKG